MFYRPDNVFYYIPTLDCTDILYEDTIKYHACSTDPLWTEIRSVLMHDWKYQSCYPIIHMRSYHMSYYKKKWHGTPLGGKKKGRKAWPFLAVTLLVNPCVLIFKDYLV